MGVNLQMKILLLRVPGNKEPHTPLAGCLYMGIGYISSFLKHKGYEKVDILDAYVEGWGYDKTAEEIKKHNYDVIGFTITFRDMITHFYEVAKRLRADGVKAHFTMGGHYPSFACKELLVEFKELDSICLFESEYTFLELVENIDKGRALNNIRGLAIRWEGEVVINEPRPLIKDLDVLPFPDREHMMNIDISKQNVTVLTSRGCYGNCSFCSVNQFYTVPSGSKWRGRSAKNIVDELEFLYKEYAIDKFAFIDDNFFGPGKKGEERILSLCDEIEGRNLKIVFTTSARVNDGHKELYKRLKEVGLIGVFLGVETGSSGSLKFYNKQVDIKRNYYAIKLMDELRILPVVGLILFEPLLKLADMMENILFLDKIKNYVVLSILDLGKLDVLKGSPLEARMLSLGLIDKINFTYEKGYHYEFLDSKVDLLWKLVNQVGEKCHKMETLVFTKLLSAYNKLYRIEYLQRSDISTLKECLDNIKIESNTKLINILTHSIQEIDKGVRDEDWHFFISNIVSLIEEKNKKALGALNIFSLLIE